MHEDIRAFIDGYAETLVWQSTDDDGEPIGRTRTVVDALSPDAWASILADCGGFLTEALPLIRTAAATGYSYEQAGHDFALTRNRHGAGYWDRGLGETGDMLTQLAHPFGESSVYVVGGALEVR